MLIGEPGVGKTAIVEGLALRILNGDVPESLKDKKLLSLDMGALIAGAKYSRRVRGAAEGRAAGSHHRRGLDHPILFIDEISPWSAPARLTARWTRPTCCTLTLDAAARDRLAGKGWVSRLRPNRPQDRP